MPQTIKLKRSATAGQAPSIGQLDLGELAINTADGKVFLRKADGTTDVIMEINGSVAGSSTSTSTGPTSPTNPAPTEGDLWFDTGNDKLMYYNGTVWVEVGSTLTDFTSTGNTIIGDTSGDTLVVNATADFNSDVNVDGNLTTTANTTIGDAAADALTVNATSTFNAPVDMNSTLNVDGAATFTNDLDVNGTTSLNGTVNLGNGGDTINVNGTNITEWTQDVVGAMFSSNTESGITVDYEDGDGTVDFNVDDFTITLGGDLGGSATITNLNSATLVATIQANSVTLGTDTTGNYVAGAGAGNGISITGTAGEGWSPTIAMTGSYTGNFTATGDITAYSDASLKEDIKTIDGGLEKVIALRGVTYKKDGHQSLGVIAQEVESILPELVQTHDDGLKSVAYGNIVSVLIEAIKELKEEVDTLKKG